MKTIISFILSIFVILCFTREIFAFSGDDGQKFVDYIYNYMSNAKTPERGEIDLRLGFDLLPAFYNKVESESVENYSYSSVPSIGFNIGAEYVIPVFRNTEAGLGASWLTPRKIDYVDREDEIVSWVPIYATLRYHPFWFLRPFYFRANLGYAFFNISGLDNMHYAANGGLTWGLGAGIPLGRDFIVEFVFNTFYGNYSGSYDVYNIRYAVNDDVQFNSFSITVVKKFNL